MEQGYQDNYHDLTTYAELTIDPTASLPPNFTVCSASVSPALLKDDSQLYFTMLGKDGTLFISLDIWIAGGMTRQMSTFYIIFGTNWHAPNISVPKVFLHQWTRSCLALSTESGLVRLVVDGRLVEDTVIEGLREAAGNRPSDLTNKLLLGPLRWSAGWFSQSNKVSNLNIFSSALATSQLVRMTTPGEKECGLAGDYLAWEEMQWTLHGEAALETVEREEPCAEQPEMTIYMAKFPSMEACMHHCQKLRGRAPSVRTLEEWNQLKAFLKKSVYGRGPKVQVNLPVTDAEEEGVWRDFYTNDTMEHTLPWTGSGPNGGEKENCALTVSENQWRDAICDFEAACTCSHVQRPYLRLRGLCSNSDINNLYLPINRKDDMRKLMFVGATNSEIEYSEQELRWKMTTVGEDTGLSGEMKKDTVAFSDSHFSSYVLGKHNWTVTNDTKCGRGKPYTVQLKLTGCEEEDFTCNDGQCVRMEQRCDQVPQCRDESDEDDCKVLSLGKSYNRKVSPITTVSNTNFTIVPVPVNISIALLKVVGLEEMSHTIQFQFNIKLEWKDGRAIYYNLKPKSALNVLSDGDVAMLWLPYVVYENTDMKEAARLARMQEWTTTVFVKRLGQLTRSGLEEVDESEVFKGTENPLLMEQTYTKTFQCQYELSHYPFDTQVCGIDMVLTDMDKDNVKLNPKELIMKENPMLTMYEITKWDLIQKTNGIKMKIVLKRRFQNELLTTYLPSILMICITFATTHFKPVYFEAALTVNLTNMLVMTTLFVSVMEKLPPTAYIKLIDIWLIVGQLLAFLEVIILTIKENLREDGDGDKVMENSPKKKHHPAEVMEGADANISQGRISKPTRIIQVSPEHDINQSYMNDCMKMKEYGDDNVSENNGLYTLSKIGKYYTLRQTYMSTITHLGFWMKSSERC
jgi:hypothetical protein